VCFRGDVLTKKAIIVLDNIKDLDRARKLKSRIDSETAVDIVLVGDVPHDLRQRDIQYVNYRSVTKKKSDKEIYERAIYWKNAFPYLRTSTGRMLCETLSLGGISICWFIDFFFTYTLLNSIKNINFAQALIRNKTPEEIFLVGNSPLILAFRMLCEKQGIATHQEKISVDRPPFRVPFPNFADLLRLLFAFLTRKNLPRSKRDVIIMCGTDIFRRDRWSKRYEDVVFGNLLAKIKDQVNVAILTKFVGTNIEPAFPATIGPPYFFVDKLWIESILNGYNIKLLLRAQNYVNWLANRLDADPVFNREFNYMNVSLWELNRADLTKLIKKFYLLGIFEISLYDRILRLTDPSLVLVSNEYGGPIKYLIFKSRIKNIPVIAIQHGIIHHYHPGYMYAKEEISSEGLDSIRFTPLPDLTLVAGEFFSKILTNCGSYPKKCVRVTGMPKYDSISNDLWKKEALEYSKRLGLSGQKKNVVVTTQTPDNDFTVEINNDLIRTIAQAIKQIGTAKLIIKAHPSEKYISSYGEICRREGIDYLLFRDVDILKLLYSCDMLLTITSTTALEAMLFQKPVIICNFFHITDPMDYVSYGIAERVDDRSDLLPKMKRLLFDEEAIKKMKERQAIAVGNYIIADGKVSDRVLEVINEYLGRNVTSKTEKFC